ncbi:MFS transporter [Periweissella cryptocerci]|uniref:Putative proline/betaine transporter n=2 Tax=Periweissella cryptocerci TaxID=2506420 RepID=A0A4P6YXG2_9LACO|nr:MFS transporter [Periweissella cryptocerci]
MSQKRVAANIIKGSLGNLIEWYDWYVYAAFAIYFSTQFFPSENQTSQLLATAAVFAVGFLMRPLGSWIMGRIADKKGRRYALTLSVTIMAGGSLIIAVTPNYQTIGVAAPIILVIARLIQGLSLGGEYGTSATYLSEMASAGKRGFYSSFQYVTLVGGQLIALAVQIVLQNLLTQAEMLAYGWRIPFVIGALGAFVVLRLRLSMDESTTFENLDADQKKDAGTIKALLRYPRQVLTVIGMTLGGTIAFYTYTTYMQKFMINSMGLKPQLVTTINFAALLIFLFLQPLGGALSDRIGRKPLLYTFGILGTILTPVIFIGLQHTKSPLIAFLLMMVGLVIVTGYTSINAIVKAELFPAEIRALGVGLPYGLTVAIFGGTVEYVALFLKQAHLENIFFYYVSGAVFISLLVYWRMNESMKTSHIEREAGSLTVSPDEVSGK